MADPDAARPPAIPRAPGAEGPVTDRPRRLSPDDPAIEAALALMRGAFASMDGVIDPPSSIHRLTPDDLRAGPGEVWVAGDPVTACMVLTPGAGALYLGKLAVAAGMRRRGLARRMIDAAEARARDLSLPFVELQTRVELIANHAAFRAMGFTETGRSAHPGHDRPTTITFRRPVPRAEAGEATPPAPSGPSISARRTP